MQMVGMAGILDQMEKSGTRINLLLLDACRDNPFRDQACVRPPAAWRRCRRRPAP